MNHTSLVQAAMSLDLEVMDQKLSVEVSHWVLLSLQPIIMFLDTYLGKEQQSTGDYAKVQIYEKKTQEVAEEIAHPQGGELSEPNSKNSLQDTDVTNSNADHTKKDIETRSESSLPEDSLISDGDINVQVKDIAPPSQENIDLVKDVDFPNVPAGNLFSDDATGKPSEESLDLKVPEVEPDVEQYKAIDITPKFTSADESTAKIGIMPVLKEEIITQDVQEDIISTIEDAYDGYISKDGKLVLDFLQAIHAAEKRQSELDAHAFALERKAMKDKY